MQIIILFFLLLFQHSVSQAEVLASDPSQDSSGVIVIDSNSPSPSAASKTLDDQNDHQADILSVQGKVEIWKLGTSGWSSAEKGITIGPGDKVSTGKNSSAEISYDDSYLNLTHLKENTLAEFRSIEPTDVYLEDGTIFNALDGLDPDASYQVSTPTYVAAVRGTHFDVNFDKSTQQFSAAALPAEDAVHESKIFVSDPRQTGVQALEVTQGKQLDIPRGKRLTPAFITQASPERIQAARQALTQIRGQVPNFDQHREQGKQRFQERMANRPVSEGNNRMQPGKGPGQAPLSGMKEKQEKNAGMKPGAGKDFKDGGPRKENFSDRPAHSRKPQAQEGNQDQPRFQNSEKNTAPKRTEVPKSPNDNPLRRNQFEKKFQPNDNKRNAAPRINEPDRGQRNTNNAQPVKNNREKHR